MHNIRQESFFIILFKNCKYIEYYYESKNDEMLSSFPLSLFYGFQKILVVLQYYMLEQLNPFLKLFYLFQKCSSNFFDSVCILQISANPGCLCKLIKLLEVLLVDWNHCNVVLRHCGWSCWWCLGSWGDAEGRRIWIFSSEKGW